MNNYIENLKETYLDAYIDAINSKNVTLAEYYKKELKILGVVIDT